MNQSKSSTAVTHVPAITQVMDLFAKNKKAIEDALPSHLKPDRMMRIALTELRKTPKLQQCDPLSFLGAIVQASQLGLEPGGALGHCYLIPYGKQCQLQIGYRGMTDLARRSGNIASISARCVYEGDEFRVSFGTQDEVIHRPSFKSKKLTHVYAVAKLKDGGVQFDIMSGADVDHIRDSFSSSYRNDPRTSPWTTSYDEMAKKTVVRRLFKMLPTSVEIRAAIEVDDNDDQQNAKIIDPTYEVLPAAPDVEKWKEANAAPSQPLDTPANKAAVEADKKLAIQEFDKAVAGIRKAGHDPEKILGRKINEILMGDALLIMGAADALTLWESPSEN